MVRNQRDSRLEVIEAAVETAKSYERNLRLRLLSINIGAAGLEVKNQKTGNKQSGPDSMDDDVYGGMTFGSSPPSSRKGQGSFAHMV